VCLGRYCGVHGTISSLLQLMGSEPFDRYGGVVYMVGGGVSCCLKLVGSHSCCVGFYCGMVRKAVPIALMDIYLLDSESNEMC
jgi:hypothetical protein